MVAGKTQVAAAVAVVALAGSTYAAPAMEPQPLVARMDKIIKAGGKVLGHVAKDHAHSTAVDSATDYLKDKFGAKPQPLHPDMAAALKKHTGPHDPKLVSAALSHLPGHKKRELEDLLTRAFDDEEFELAARMDKIIKAGGKVLGHVAKDHAHSTAVDSATDYLKDKFGAKPQPLHPDAAAALKKHTGPHDPKLVSAALGHLPGHKKRELEDALEELLARDFADEDFELAARMDKIVKAGGKILGHVAKDHAHSTAVDHANDYLKDKFGAKPAPLHPDAAAALKKATGPHDPKLVAAAIGKKKRGVEDGLYARMDKIIKAGGKVLGHVAKDHAHSTAVDHANDYLKDKFGAKPAPLHPDAVAALKKATGPHDPKLVAAVVGKKKRELEDEIADILARAFDDEEYELVARMDKIVKAGGKLLGHVAKDHAHSTAVDSATDYIKDKFGPKPQPLHPDAAAAIKKMTGPHDPKLVSAALAHLPGHGGHKKREIEDDALELFARGIIDEDTYELVTRMDKIVKAGGKLLGHVAKDHAHSTAVDHANDYLKDKFGAKPAPLHPDAAAALKKATGPHDPKIVAAALGKKKRSFEDDVYEIFSRGYEYDDLE